MPRKRVTAAADKPRDEILAETPKSTSPWDAAASIHVRMLRARADVGPIRLKRFEMKRRSAHPNAQDQIVAEFDALSHHEVVEHCRPALLKHGILFRPKIMQSWQEGNKSFVILNAEFVNVDRPDDVFVVEGVPGEGNDNGDKGFGKALSYAKKHAYALALELSPGTDNETEHVETVRPEAQAEQPTPQQVDPGAYITLSLGGPPRAVLCADVLRLAVEHILTLPTAMAVSQWEYENRDALRQYWQWNQGSGLTLRRAIDARKMKLAQEAKEQDQAA